MSVLEYDGAAAASAVIMSHEMRAKKIMFVEGIHDGRLFSSIFQDDFLPVAAKDIEYSEFFSSLPRSCVGVYT
ncbi:MAG: hypothetical protein GY862_08400 [Gammaproteobacteria bacterium]|nr:hypothetical protein [Gammaproteobacteria bacterium]